jgi:hypothetical protein
MPWCYECNSHLKEGEGKVLKLDFWVFDENGKESFESRDERVCDECAAEFEKPNGELGQSD